MNNQNIKVGDKVVCINDVCYRSVLKRGNKYTVKKVSSDMVMLAETKDHIFFHTRFEIVEESNGVTSFHVQKWENGAFQKYHESSYSEIDSAINFFKDISGNHPSTKYALVMRRGGIDTVIETRGKDGPEAPMVNSYTMKYNRDDKCVEFGCAKIDVSLIMNLKTIMGLLYEGNRRVTSITLDSGVSLTRPQIIEIGEYIEDINNGK